MIKNFTPKPFGGINELPNYVTSTKSFDLIARVVGGYEITLAKLTVGQSMSAGSPLTHALFESFTDHGERRRATRTRSNGFNEDDREFAAVRNAMCDTGISFNPALPCDSEGMLEALGRWFQDANPEIEEVSVVSQRCH
ncbi:MAG: hypothetical protein J6J93_01360 [Muribaculaceae bacterium]|nr:hypothetical protein [Muribaculaceae bacterium]